MMIGFAIQKPHPIIILRNLEVFRSGQAMKSDIAAVNKTNHDQIHEGSINDNAIKEL